MVQQRELDSSVPLPPGLTVAAIRRAVEYIERELADVVDIYYEQANVFSALVGIYGTKALDAFSVYEKSRHLDMAQQRFPDLCRKGSGPNRSPNECLESKAANARGNCSRTMITRVGISFGATWSTRLRRWNLASPSSFGA